MPPEPPSAFVSSPLSDSRHSRTSRRPTIAPLWSPSDSALPDNSQALARTRLISSKMLSPRFSSRRSWAFSRWVGTIAVRSWLRSESWDARPFFVLVREKIPGVFADRKVEDAGGLWRSGRDYTLQ